ncbi:hypothetical protein WICANDRAFT_75863 [Wickerhamomyces anomalus NRRL Y-366-8]|uniref:t-SNARE coiled-coil homology domain-containing protein n=1 Tax=Wickerhamomyces anomalus (strain ATCC 58044 / CBS 1984 / NCYC 433 / NRRL Y-366-8) TaxID=683960 RepID=A0A1E3P9U5_WICAA|nr:uncharacterized protein WICANDRAFT_75863 [Wickerhamomyces anomalus NRRL Y-366-8]ODQ61657.1 hypothetical protein WICANDRAFT_75863 [Wickerhamomyces anomalus NRRL Y-366-8]
MASSQLHQRERTSLFDQPQRVSSPYDKQTKADYNESELSHLESQNDDEMGVMSTKIQQLKGLSLRMGEEIRGSNKTLEELGNSFDQLGTRLKNTFNRMLVMAKRSGISIKTWFFLFVFVILFFFWVWIH